MIRIEEGKLIRYYDGEKLQAEAWGKNAIRVRVTKLPEFTPDDRALLPPEKTEPVLRVFRAGEKTERIDANGDETIVGESAELIVGKLRLEIRENGKLVFRNEAGKLLLGEYEYDETTCLCLRTREMKTLMGGNFSVSLKFASAPTEKLYGMGEYQNGIFDLKGTTLELAQRNSQASVPFVLSSLGYGFLWNDPSVGKVAFGTNMTEWEAKSTKQIDFWITAGDSPAEIHMNYMNATGRPPMMPEHGLGFWQSRLRYRTQEEVLTVARKYKELGIPLDAIVIDFFHWSVEGVWDFDRRYWPDPKKMVEELRAMGIRPVVSVWPTVAVNAPEYEYMRDRGYLIRAETGLPISMLMVDATMFFDVTNPEAAKYLWEKLKKSYYEYGFRDFWLDASEPPLRGDCENYRFFRGNALEVGNEYPREYVRLLYDGLRYEGVEEPVSLVRCAWAGSQRYGALVWSGDVPSTFRSFRYQIVCGLQMAMAGISWWNSDIGGFRDSAVEGFRGGWPEDDTYRELVVRWFQYGAFCPAMRLHGCRQPGLPAPGTDGGGKLYSGAENELWSYGEECYEIFRRYIAIREGLRPYLRETFREASETGAPVLRPLFYAFPEDKSVWDIWDEYLLGADILAAPVTEPGKRERRVYLPAGTDWTDAWTGERKQGGAWYDVSAPLERIPVFLRAGRETLCRIFAE